jgi:hypothetical protein
MRDALAELGLFAELGVGVNLIVVARETGEGEDRVFAQGAANGFDF